MMHFGTVFGSSEGLVERGHADPVPEETGIEEAGA